MSALLPDFFVFNGDQIYADDTSCSEKKGPYVVMWQNVYGNLSKITWNSVNWNDLVELHSIYLDHWEYNRTDTRLQILKKTSMYSQADDHEVINNYGGSWSYLPANLKIDQDTTI
jgi:phosphodiesterase/alkaline phosphatase D-like protein